MDSIRFGERSGVPGANGRRVLVAVVALLLIVGVVAWGLSLKTSRSDLEARPPGQRPELLLLTGLPIVFPEQFTLAAGSPVLSGLQDRYRVVPISVADRSTLAGHRLLLMAQPRAQPAYVLVELDQWVRSGGRVLLLADPALQWPSERPLGDPLRPPFAFADTGLLGHWGLRLDTPEKLGQTTIQTGGREIRTSSPGALVATGPDCSVGKDLSIGRCRIGSGKATIISDADFIDVGRFGEKNLQPLFAELQSLEQ